MRVSAALNGDSPEQKWTVCTCNNCAGHLEFDATRAGETIQCPHCKLDTVLFIPPDPIDGQPQVGLPPPKSETKKPRLWLEPVILLVIAIGLFFVGAYLVDRSIFGDRTPSRIVLITLIVALFLFVYAIGKGIWRFARLKLRLPPLHSILERKHWLVVAAVALILALVFWPREETLRQENRRLSRGAEALMRIEVESVVGWRRTLHSSIYCADGAPATWVGHADVEIINDRGGVEARRVKVRFQKNSTSDSDAQLSCYAYLEKP